MTDHSVVFLELRKEHRNDTTYGALRTGSALPVTDAYPLPARPSAC